MTDNSPLDNEFQPGFFDLRDEGDVAVVTLKKEQLTDDENLEQMDQELNQVLGMSAGRKMVCDLSTVRNLTSSAIGKLISLHRKSIRTQSRFVLCGLQPTARDILATSHLLQYFAISPDATSAVAELK